MLSNDRTARSSSEPDVAGASGAANGRVDTLTGRALGVLADPRSTALGIGAMKIAVAIIFIWIGWLKFQPYEADSITPFVANSPLLRFFYLHPADYAAHLTKEGILVPAQRAWQIANRTYAFSTGLGSVELLIGGLTLAGLWSKRLGMVGALLAFATPFVTLSFLATTPEAWVPALGDAQHGFPYLSGPGRLVVKDVALLAGSWLIMADTARQLLMRRGHSTRATGVR
ncbi:reactive chlorine resistance membrane protein RclC [Sphingomonas sp. UYP23]